MPRPRETRMKTRRPIFCHGEKVVGAFTLIELLVVIAIIAILASRLLQALTKAKEQGSRARCISNMKQILLSTQMYVNDSNDYTPYTSWSSGTFDQPNWCYTRIRGNNPDHTVEKG